MGCEPGRLLEIGMDFHLMSKRFDSRFANDISELMRREVGNANVQDFVLWESYHGSPRLWHFVSNE